MLKDNRGVTLMEIMVVVAILSFLMTAIFGILLAGRNSWLTGDALLSVQQEARLGVENMSRELRMARNALVGGDNRTVKFNIPFDADNSGYLDFIGGTNMIAYGADDPTDYNANGQLWELNWNIEYQIDPVNNQIIRNVRDDSDTIVNSRVIVRNINPDVALTYFKTDTGGTGLTEKAVEIGLTTRISQLEGRTISPPIQFALVVTVKLRNQPL